MQHEHTGEKDQVSICIDGGDHRGWGKSTSEGSPVTGCRHDQEAALCQGGNKAVVAIEHGKLPDEGAVAAVKQLWGGTLDRLKSTLEGKK